MTTKDLAFDGRAFNNGERAAARDGQTFDCFSPVDGRLLTAAVRWTLTPPSPLAAPPLTTGAGAA